MKILITGGAGFIGSHIVDRLLQDGHELTVLDLWESPEMLSHKDNPNFTFVTGSVLDENILPSLVEGKDRVIHMAAILGTSETITTYDVEDVAMVNVIGTVRMLKTAKKFGVPRVLIPTTPDVPWINPYKITKQAIEKFCQLFSKEYGVETLNDLYKLNTLVEVIKILSSDSQFKNLDNSDREILLKGSIKHTITPQTLSDEITELGSEISDLETKRKDFYASVKNLYLQDQNKKKKVFLITNKIPEDLKKQAAKEKAIDPHAYELLMNSLLSHVNRQYSALLY